MASRAESVAGTRAGMLFEAIRSALPEHHVLVFVLESSCDTEPFIVGPTKGLAKYTEPEVGHKVFVLVA